ncbi:hypothetical protein GCM10009677_61460 [Sphaerisporangium rubeum]
MRGVDLMPGAQFHNSREWPLDRGVADVVNDVLIFCTFDCSVSDSVSPPFDCVRGRRECEKGTVQSHDAGALATQGPPGPLSIEPSQGTAQPLIAPLRLPSGNSLQTLTVVMYAPVTAGEVHLRVPRRAGRVRLPSHFHHLSR